MNNFELLFGGAHLDEDEIEIPKNLAMCEIENSVTAGIRKYAKIMGVFGQCIGIFILVITIIKAFQASDSVNYYDDADIFLSIIVPGCLLGLAVVLIFDFVKILLLALASIVHNTTVTARVALLNAEKILSNVSGGPAGYRKIQNTPAVTSASQRQTTTDQRAVISDGGWVCNCGHVNSKVKNACSRCGKAKEG